MFVLNIPNALTILRIALIPVFVGCFFSGHTTAALCAYITAGLTDALDGYLARKLNQITSFGKLMDPLADKLMQVSMLLCLCSEGYVPWCALFILLGKEIILVTGGAVLLKKRHVVVKSNWSGKTATVLLIAAIISLYPWHDIALLTQAGRILLFAGLGMSLYAAVNYGLLYVKNSNPSKAD